MIARVVIAGCLAGILGVLGVGHAFPPSVETPTATPQPSALARDVVTDPGAPPSIAISLTLLQREAQRLAAGGRPLPREFVELMGINRIRGFMVEPGGEVFLLADRGTDSDMSPIALGDLADAVRNAYQVGGPYAGVPGVSIDPDHDAADPWALQKVRLIGLPPSPMSARMVAIDYELKKVSSGLLRIGSLPSLWDLRERAGPSCLGNGAGPGGHDDSTRFWFQAKVPPRPRFIEDSGTVLILRPIDVELLSEPQPVDGSGVRPPPSPEVEAFARLVTNELLAAGALPHYRALRQDFRVLEVGALFAALRVPRQRLPR